MSSVGRREIAMDLHFEHLKTFFSDESIHWQSIDWFAKELKQASALQIPTWLRIQWALLSVYSCALPMFYKYSVVVKLGSFPPVLLFFAFSSDIGLAVVGRYFPVELTHGLLSPLNMAAAISAECTFAVSSFIWFSSAVALRRHVSMPLLRRCLCVHYKDKRHKRSNANVLIAKAYKNIPYLMTGQYIPIWVIIYSYWFLWLSHVEY